MPEAQSWERPQPLCRQSCVEGHCGVSELLHEVMCIFEDIVQLELVGRKHSSHADAERLVQDILCVEGCNDICMRCFACLPARTHCVVAFFFTRHCVNQVRSRRLKQQNSCSPLLQDKEVSACHQTCLYYMGKTCSVPFFCVFFINRLEHRLKEQGLWGISA